MDIIEKLIQKARPASRNGVAGLWMDEHQMVEAAAKVRAAGFTQIEAISPFPLHGIDDALAIPRSFIPWVTFIFGLAGFAFGTWFTWWASAVDWPLIVGGKPMWSLAAFVPIMFELTILFAALSSVGALIYTCGLPQVDPPVIDPALTSHKFALWVPEGSAGFNGPKLEQMFKELGANEVKKAEF
jgi:hypothetical protein